MNIKNRLRQVRESFGLNQMQFVEKMQTSQSTISALEKGDRALNAEVVIRICDLFNLNTEWLLRGTGPMHKGDPKTGDASLISQPQKTQHTENMKSKKEMTGDASPVVESQREIMELFKKNMELQERLMAVMQENADLRVQAERDATRIRELERENEALKGERSE
ncbi:helix-turn-helix transcriptional regulator [uncultured Bilophila sp.]|uniref:helix-turn-helix domain-containing protein n=1 Tax=uncultured Bilophila sp. TaxID=529385 RepID=UPI00280C0533|nr:helix-turn-helix transcriptional regulator [uncultured Bilophila sp.]